MTRHKIPTENTDLRKYAIKVYLSKISLYILYVAFWTAGYLFYLDGPRAKPLEWWALIIFAVAVLISGWMIFNMGRLVRSKNVCGRLISTKLTRNYDRAMSRDGKNTHDYHTYLHLTVREDGGRNRKIKIQLFDEGYDLYYNQGNRLLAFKGLNYPISIESEEKNRHICTVCGARSDNDCVNGKIYCQCCGHSIININNIDDIC